VLLNLQRSLKTPLVAGAVVALAIGLFGCGSDGAGSIKLEPGARERAEGKPTTGKVTPKQAKAKELEEEAGRKNPKLK
jgi:hypothetical protein